MSKSFFPIVLILLALITCACQPGPYIKPRIKNVSHYNLYQFYSNDTYESTLDGICDCMLLMTLKSDSTYHIEFSLPEKVEKFSGHYTGNQYGRIRFFNGTPFKNDELQIKVYRDSWNYRVFDFKLKQTYDSIKTKRFSGFIDQVYYGLEACRIPPHARNE